jgi:predicted amidohydrolase
MCQIFALDGDRRGNFVRIENAISEAKDGGADVACFPEAVILGWVNSDAHKRAHSIPGPDSDHLCRLAGDHDIHLCVGLAEKEGGSLYDSAVLIDNSGQILLKHRKINLLAELMSPPYTPGEGIDAVETGLGKIGLLICADTHEAEILERMAALKPDLLLKNTAQRTGAFTVGTNLVGEITKGPWKGRVYGGQSVAVDKTGRTIAKARDRDRDINIVRW